MEPRLGPASAEPQKVALPTPPAEFSPLCVPVGQPVPKLQPWPKGVLWPKKGPPPELVHAAEPKTWAPKKEKKGKLSKEKKKGKKGSKEKDKKKELNKEHKKEKKRPKDKKVKKNKKRRRS